MSVLHKLALSIREDDFGMEERAGYAGRDGDEVALSVEDFDLTGAREFGKVDGASAADAGGGGFVGGDGRKLGQELAGVNEEGRLPFLVSASSSRFLTGLSARFRMTNFFFDSNLSAGMADLNSDSRIYFLDSVSLGDVELGHSGAAKGFEMGSAAEALAHFVGDRTHVGSRGYAGAEVGAVAVAPRE